MKKHSCRTYIYSHLPENNVEPVPTKTWQELALHYFWAECFGGSQFGGDRQTILKDERLSEIWRELALHYFWAECF
jgi:hypothetical protein